MKSYMAYSQTAGPIEGAVLDDGDLDYLKSVREYRNGEFIFEEPNG